MIKKMFFCLVVCFSNAALAAETKPFFPGITHDSVIEVFRMLFPDLHRVHCEDDSFGKSCKYEDEEASVYVFFGEKGQIYRIYSKFFGRFKSNPKTISNLWAATVLALRAPDEDRAEIQAYINAFLNNKTIENQPKYTKVSIDIRDYFVRLDFTAEKTRR